MKTNLYYIIIAVVLLLDIPAGAIAQDEQEVMYPYMTLKYIKNSDNQKVLEAVLLNSTEIAEMPVEGLPVTFYTNMDDPQPVGEAVTGMNGIASIVINQDTDIPVTGDGSFWFSAEFTGNETAEMTNSEVTVKDVNLEMTLEDGGEGARSVTLTAWVMYGEERVPVTDETVYLKVDRMFRDLDLGEASLDGEGNAVFDFPEGIPGDDEGHLVIKGMFSDHWEFGTVVKEAEVTWGVPAEREIRQAYRALWTQIAPRWMIITLTILLLGVWGHYLFAVISLVMVALEGKRLSKEE